MDFEANFLFFFLNELQMLQTQVRFLKSGFQTRLWFLSNDFETGVRVAIKISRVKISLLRYGSKTGLA